MADQKPASKTRKPPAKRRPRPYVVIDRRNGLGWLIALFIISGCMFFLGVLVGRNTLPVRFDMDNLQEKLGNLKESVLKNKDLFRPESVQPVDVLSQLQEKGKKPDIYKQYIPPVIKPKFSKTDPARHETTAEPEKSSVKAPAGKHQLPAACTMPAGPETPDSPSPIGEASSTAGQIPDAAGAAPMTDTPPLKAVKAAKFAKTPESSSSAVKTPAPVEFKPGGGEPAAPPTTDVAPADAPAESAVDSPSVPAAGTALPLYVIQVASLKEREKADSLRRKFISRGYPAYSQSSEIKGVIWYRVRIGPYPNRAMAEKDCSSLKEAGVDGLVFRIEN